MKNLRQQFERFCFRNRTKGIPNLMLYVALGSAIVYVMSMVDDSATLYLALCFDRAKILQGQVWRLFTYAFTYSAGNILITAIGLLCYFSLGRAMENAWGTFKFNLFYLTGIVLMDIYALIFNMNADIYYLNLSLFLGYATLYPNAQFLFLFIIPVKAWIFALIDLAMILYQLIAYPWPFNVFPVVALANYFLFFGKDVRNVIPRSWRVNASRVFGKKGPKKTGTIPFNTAGSYQATVTRVNAPYTHRCTVCGRTDVSNPDLEFRYCSRCNGYYCYCEEHISNHNHIE
ncbi:MAG: hypothetical protein IJB47_04735 [Oscillospiraceae bacterium]|nr:hypothetical protein [Oscillospiraceae bacterium]